MGLRFRRSVKIAPGTRLNIGKKSVGISFGGKYGGISTNSRTGTTARISAPGTGVSYTTKVDGVISKNQGSSELQKSPAGLGYKKPIYKRGWYILVTTLFLVLTLVDIILYFGQSRIPDYSSMLVLAIVVALIAIGIGSFVSDRKAKKISENKEV